MEDVRYFISDSYPVDDAIDKVLHRMAEAEGVVKPVVALPDLHFKHSYSTPTGIVALVKDRIIPKFLNANCGMSFIITPFMLKDLTEDRMDKIFGMLRKNISVSIRKKPLISFQDLKGIISNGAGWTLERYGLDSADIMNFENEGSILKGMNLSYRDVERYLPSFAKEIALLSMGVLGYGNHFIELQTVDDIIDRDVAQVFGISKGQLCFMMHGDSRGFGQSLIDHYSKRNKKMLGLQQIYKKMHYKILAQEWTPDIIREVLDKTNFYLNRFKSTAYWKMGKVIKKENASFRAIDPSTEEGRAYLLSTYCAIDFGYANRTYMAAMVNEALKEVFGSGSGNIRILHDGNHDALQEENIDGERFFVHRNGAARALPSHYYRKHPVFSQTGQPVLLPSALGRPSYLCAAKDGAKSSYYSSCHGTGRQVDRGEARELFKEKDVFDEAKKINMKIYDYGKGKASEEAPAAFKDVNKILDTISKHGMAQPVVKLRPLAGLKGWR